MLLIALEMYSTSMFYTVDLIHVVFSDITSVLVAVPA